MSHDPTFWLLARASGLTAYVAADARRARRADGQDARAGPGRARGERRRRAPLPDDARAGRAGDPRRTLVLDTTVKITPLALLVPGLSPYRPLPVGAGRARRRADGARDPLVPRPPPDRAAHLARAALRHVPRSSCSATAHGLLAGTDSSAPWAFGLYLGAVGAVAAATAWRALTVVPRPDRKEQPHDHVPHHRRPLAVQRIRHLHRARPRDLRARPRAASRPCASARATTRPCSTWPRPARWARSRSSPRRRHDASSPSGALEGCEGRVVMIQPRRVAIVGAGLAGSRCAETLRGEGFEGEIVLLGESRTRRTSGPRSRRSCSPAHAATSRSGRSTTGRARHRPPARHAASNGSTTLRGRRGRDRHRRARAPRSPASRASTSCARSTTPSRSASTSRPGGRLVVIGAGLRRRGGRLDRARRSAST